MNTKDYLEAAIIGIAVGISSVMMFMGHCDKGILICLWASLLISGLSISK